MQNDRNKRKKEVKEDLGGDELSPELAELVRRVSRAHQETFPSLGQLGKYTTVSRDGSLGGPRGNPNPPPNPWTQGRVAVPSCSPPNTSAGGSWGWSTCSGVVGHQLSVPRGFWESLWPGPQPSDPQLGPCSLLTSPKHKR